MDIQTLQAYAYIGSLAVLVLGLYWYIVYIYRGKSRGVDYEKYSNLALHDDIDDEIVEARDERSSIKTAEGSKE